MRYSHLKGPGKVKVQLCECFACSLWQLTLESGQGPVALIFTVITFWPERCQKQTGRDTHEVLSAWYLVAGPLRRSVSVCLAI